MTEHLTRAEATEMAIDIASDLAVEAAEPAVIRVCQGGRRCTPGSDTETCAFCEVIVCLPDGTVERRSPSVC